MAYMNQQRKAERMPAIKAVLKKYGMKGSVRVLHHATLVVTLSSGEIDFGSEYLQVNHYWIEDHYQGAAKDFLLELKDAMLGNDYFNDSDAQIDYFSCSHYISINVGCWDKPYILNSLKAAA